MTGIEVPRVVKRASLERIERRTGSPANPRFVSDRGTEICTVCGQDTGVPAHRHIALRAGYETGLGHCCRACAGA
jgi:hypothetical protein